MRCSLSLHAFDDRPLKTSSERKKCRAERKTGPELVPFKGQVNTAREKKEMTEKASDAEVVGDVYTCVWHSEHSRDS